MTTTLNLPDGYDEYDWRDVEAKGWLESAKVWRDGREYSVAFYDPVRLAQEVASDLSRGRYFSAERLLVVPSVTVENMADAVSKAPPGFFGPA
jgi:hypothetical protein